MTKNIQNNISMEDFFKHTSEDIATYLQAVRSWSEPPEGYSYGYLFILTLSNRARSRYALDLIEKMSLTEGYVYQKGRLTTLWQEAEKILLEQIFEDKTKLEEIINGELIQRIEDLKSSLQEVRHIAQDGDLIGNSDWVAEDLENVATDFLLRFQDIYLTKGELKTSLLSKTESFTTFETKLNEVEGLFKNYFGYFYQVSDFLSNLKNREYGLEAWWFTRIPKEEEIEEEEISEDVMKEIWRRYKSMGRITTEACPETELVIAYALGELASNERMKIRNHILKCRLCLDLVTDVGYAEAVSEESDEVSERLFRRVKEKFLETISEAHPPYISILEFKSFFDQFAQRPIQISASLRQAAGEEEEQTISELLTYELLSTTKLKLKTDERGKYALPDSPEKEYCDSPEDYQKINKLIKEAKTYWGGFAIKSNGEFKKFEPAPIRRFSLSGIKIDIEPKQNYKSLIIGISGNQKELKRGLEAFEKKAKTISSLNIIWIKCDLE